MYHYTIDTILVLSLLLLYIRTIANDASIHGWEEISTTNKQTDSTQLSNSEESRVGPLALPICGSSSMQFARPNCTNTVGILKQNHV